MLVGSSVLASDFEFKVLAKKGNMHLIDKANKRSLVKIGAVINASHKIVVPTGGYLGLVHKSGKTIELTKPGTFNVAEIAQELKAKHTNLANKYANYIVTKLSDDVTDENYNYQRHLKVTGAVERGNENTINLLMPKYVNILNEEVLVQWNKLNLDAKYVVTVKNMYGKTVFSNVTKENSILLNLSGTHLKSNNILIINVQVENRKDILSEDYAIKRMSTEEIATLKREVNSLIAVDGNSSSINSLMLANFYEQNNLIVDALAAYEKAKELSPNSPQFKTAYNAFLLRHFLM